MLDYPTIINIIHFVIAAGLVYLGTLAANGRALPMVTSKIFYVTAAVIVFYHAYRIYSRSYGSFNDFQLNMKQRTSGVTDALFPSTN